MGGRVPLDSYGSLYAAGADVLIAYVAEIDAGVDSALVVGHNPGIFELAWSLLVDPDDESAGSDRAVLDNHGFPTCSLAVVAVEASSWAEVQPEHGHLRGLFKPPY